MGSSMYVYKVYIAKIGCGTRGEVPCEQQAGSRIRPWCARDMLVGRSTKVYLVERT